MLMSSMRRPCKLISRLRERTSDLKSTCFSKIFCFYNRWILFQTLVFFNRSVSNYPHPHCYCISKLGPNFFFSYIKKPKINCTSTNLIFYLVEGSRSSWLKISDLILKFCFATFYFSFHKRTRQMRCQMV